jgi:hypothetical protein
MKQTICKLVVLGIAAILVGCSVSCSVGCSVGCNTSGNANSNNKPVETHNAGDLNIVIMNDTGELHQGKNDFVLQFQNQQGQPVDVGAVQVGSSMAMPGMAPMSGDSEVAPAGQTGAYRVQSNFAMSGAWRFTVEWSGPRGPGKTTFNHNVR